MSVFFQRGSDELLSQTGGAVSNGGTMSPQPNHTDNNNDAKKVSKLVSVCAWPVDKAPSPPKQPTLKCIKEGNC